MGDEPDFSISQLHLDGWNPDDYHEWIERGLLKARNVAPLDKAPDYRIKMSDLNEFYATKEQEFCTISTAARIVGCSVRYIIDLIDADKLIKATRSPVDNPEEIQHVLVRRQVIELSHVYRPEDEDDEA